MLKINIASLFFMGVIPLLLQNCASTKVSALEGGFTYSGIYFGSYLPFKYQQGIIDGCTTAKGNYKKSHILFNKDIDYYHGWFLGRNRCRNLLKIDKNGDLIL